MEGVPRVLVLGHSFVKWLKRDLDRSFNARAARHFGLIGSAEVFLHGVGGRTVPKLKELDLHVVRRIQPRIIILEIGTNDLSHTAPEKVGSDIEELCVFLRSFQSVAVVGVCHVIPRGLSAARPHEFHDRAKLLQTYLEVVIEPLQGAFCWRHRVFSSPDKDLYRRDGVHLNVQGQYLLYRSYRGAILHSLSFLS